MAGGLTTVIASDGGGLTGIAIDGGGPTAFITSLDGYRGLLLTAILDGFQEVGKGS